MSPKIYIETTVVGHLTSRLPRDRIVAGRMLETRKWWEEKRQLFNLFVSDIVIEECLRGDATASAERMKVLEGIPILDATDECKALATILVKRHALPDRARIDAIHLAIAAYNDVDYLLTWNCKHLANPSLREKIAEVCQTFGVRSPLICTPFDISEALS